MICIWCWFIRPAAAVAANRNEFKTFGISIAQSRTLTTRSEPVLFGRANSSMHLFFHDVLPLGALAGDAIAQALGMRQALLISAIRSSTFDDVAGMCSPVRRLRELPHAVGEIRARAPSSRRTHAANRKHTVRYALARRQSERAAPHSNRRI